MRWPLRRLSAAGSGHFRADRLDIDPGGKTVPVAGRRRWADLVTEAGCLEESTRLLPVVGPLMTPAARWRSEAGRWGRSTGGTRLEIEPDQWWHGRVEGRLVVDVTRVEPTYEDDGTVAWVVVEGWRVLPGGGRVRARELVRAVALRPPQGGGGFG